MELRERRVEENPRQPEKKNEEYLILTLKTSSSLTMNVILYASDFSFHSFPRIHSSTA